MNLNFEDVIQYYYEQEKFTILSNFHERNLNPIKEWLKNDLKRSNGKDSTKSTCIRKQGNIFYKEKSLKKCLEYYNSSICCAQDNSEEYFLALANRSAVTYEFRRYEECLKDVELCLNSSTYPMNLRPKLYNRKSECLKNLKLNQSSNEAENLKDLPTTVKNERLDKKVGDICTLPGLKGGENPCFAYASSMIDMRYNISKGRHVVAKRRIQKGDILFLEKAFAFGTIFDKHSRTMNMMKCCHCLKTIYSGVPCKYCAKCIFCDSGCRDKSWEDSHRWECRGMFGDFWYHLGIAFPALRALLKGVDSKFEEIEGNNVKCFGNKEDNYPFFNSLVFDKNNKHLDVLIMSVTVSTYLKEYTNYFDWFLSQPNNSNWGMDRIIIFFETQLSRHILQFQNNSSIIEHWLEGENLPLEKEPVACGIFPSVSIMNHSCKPNITNYFICDTIVVKALQDIKENEEIFNCYGISYRLLNKKERQKSLFQLYHFECKCVICSDPTKEMDAFDSFLCQNCGKDIPKMNKKSSILCQNCGTEIDYRILIEKSQCIDGNEDENDEASLQHTLDCRKKLLSRYHSNLQNTYFKLYHLSKELGNHESMLKYFEEWFKVERIKVAQDLPLFGVLLHEVGTLLISKFNNPKNANKEILNKAQNFITEAEQICSLYYPPHVIVRIKPFIQTIY